MGQGVKNILLELAEQIGDELNYEVVDAALTKEGPNRILRVFIDRPEGIGLEDCELFSRRFSALLDEKDPIPTAYLLEVSSPGLERPLTKPEHFRQFTDQGVELKLFTPVEGRRKVKGRLQGWTDQDGGKVLVEAGGATMEIPWKAIAKARLAYID